MKKQQQQQQQKNNNNKQQTSVSSHSRAFLEEKNGPKIQVNFF